MGYDSPGKKVKAQWANMVGGNNQQAHRHRRGKKGDFVQTNGL